jgi:hypothetical protein
MCRSYSVMSEQSIFFDGLFITEKSEREWERKRERRSFNSFEQKSVILLMSRDFLTKTDLPLSNSICKKTNCYGSWSGWTFNRFLIVNCSSGVESEALCGVSSSKYLCNYAAWIAHARKVGPFAIVWIIRGQNSVVNESKSQRHHRRWNKGKLWK